MEFSPRGSFPEVTGIVGGGPFNLKPGQWTDDTSMALCLAESLVEKNAFDPMDQMARYLNWWQWGYLSSTGTCFDIGGTVRAALTLFQTTGHPYAGSSDPESAGNGSLMRLAPVSMFGFRSPELIPNLAADSSRTTHGAAEAIECCQLLAILLYRCLSGHPRQDLMSQLGHKFYQANVRALSEGSFASMAYSELRGSGYCVRSLEAALWCFFNTDSYAGAVLAAVNLGEDADTTGAIAGQLAGAYYGASAIPAEWAAQLAMREDIESLASRLYVQSVT